MDGMKLLRQLFDPGVPEPLAPPGGILVDARTRELLDDVVPIEAFGEVALKGFGSPQPAFRVVG